MLGVVLVGGNGFLGSHLARSLRKKARVVVTYAKHQVPIEGVLSLPIDVRDVAGMRRILTAQKPDVVVYLGGPEDHTWVDTNPKLADKVFISGPGDILHLTEMISARFLYISSTSVFDGTRGNYQETETVSPATLLGKLKASGENLVRGRSNRSSVLRLSPLVGSSHPWRPSLFDQIRQALSSQTRIELRNDEYHSWTTVSCALTAIEAIIAGSPKNALYHYGGLTRLTHLEMGQLFARSLGYPENVIHEFMVPKKRVFQKGMIVLPEGEKFDLSLNSTQIIRALEVSAYPIEEKIREEFKF